MLSYFKFTDDGVALSEPKEAAFLNLEDPTQDEIDHVERDLKIPRTFMNDPLDLRERPRIDQEPPVTLVIVRVSRYPFSQTPHRHTTIPLGIIITKDKIVTICRDKGLVMELLGRASRKPRPNCRTSLAFKLLIESSTDFIRHLERLEELTDKAESTLSKAQHNEEIMMLLSIDKDLINLSVALRSNRGIMEKLMENSLIHLRPDEMDLLERALTENQQAIYTAEIFGQILGSVSDVFGTIISNNLNKVVKFLTGITIILMLPTLIAGLYGMNVALPLSGLRHAFWIILLVCSISGILLWIFFSRKKWV
ncbi:MAG: magnesium transporter CorA family protein [Deltaproteobacteria bacterium]|jgi:magnesium transporter|nr:magnesium transporter CorA family protein [Deltaproteobacteria bacterium]